MVRRLEMLARVTIGRRVATTNVAAMQTDAKVHPGASGLQAVLTSFGAGLDFTDLSDVSALGHDRLLR